MSEDDIRHQLDGVSGTLGLIDERTRNMNQKVDDLTDEMKSQISRVHKRIDSETVSKETFKPVQMIVYGIVGMCLAAVLFMILQKIGLSTPPVHIP